MTARRKKLDMTTLKVGQVLEVTSNLPLPEPVTVTIVKVPEGGQGRGLAQLHLHEVLLGEYAFLLGSHGSLLWFPVDQPKGVVA